LLSHTRSPHPPWNGWPGIIIKWITLSPLHALKHKVTTFLPTRVTFITMGNWILWWRIN
jgi:hypothetical protein